MSVFLYWDELGAVVGAVILLRKSLDLKVRATLDSEGSVLINDVSRRESGSFWLVTDYASTTTETPDFLRRLETIFRTSHTSVLVGVSNNLL